MGVGAGAKIDATAAAARAQLREHAFVTLDRPDLHMTGERAISGSSMHRKHEPIPGWSQATPRDPSDGRRPGDRPTRLSTTRCRRRATCRPRVTMTSRPGSAPAAARSLAVLTVPGPRTAAPGPGPRRRVITAEPCTSAVTCALVCSAAGSDDLLEGLGVLRGELLGHEAGRGVAVRLQALGSRRRGSPRRRARPRPAPCARPLERPPRRTSSTPSVPSRPSSQQPGERTRSTRAGAGRARGSEPRRAPPAAGPGPVTGLVPRPRCCRGGGARPASRPASAAPSLGAAARRRRRRSAGSASRWAS